MLKKSSWIVGTTLGALVILFWLAGRPLGDLIGYFRAGAETTVNQIENEIPDVVHDKKTAAELEAARQQLVDRQTQLNLSQNQLKDLSDDIAQLTQAIERRQDVLASAYPVLASAMNNKVQQVVIINDHFALDEFQREIDDLLALQKRDEDALRIKQQGFQRLEKSVHDGESAVGEMKNQLAAIGQQFDVLKARREQAHLESETLDLIAGATTDQSSTTASINQGVERLESEVVHLEAQNKARRNLSPLDSRATQSKLANSFNRLETLKKYASSNGSLTSENEPNPKSQTLATPLESTTRAQQVVIKIQSETN